MKEHFEFTSDVMVGNTMVKKGYYLVKYNPETGMVKVIIVPGTAGLKE